MESFTLPTSKISMETALKDAFKKVSEFINGLTEQQYQQRPDGKWSPAEHFSHLTKSAYPVTSALKQPKFIFRAFGTSKTGSVSMEDLEKRYRQLLSEGVKAPKGMVPVEKDLLDKTRMLNNWETIINKFRPRLEKWSENDLDKYKAPHPALGKITFREMLYFTIFHTRHHLQIMKDRVEES